MRVHSINPTDDMLNSTHLAEWHLLLSTVWNDRFTWSGNLGETRFAADVPVGNGNTVGAPSVGIESVICVQGSYGKSHFFMGKP
jgi:hypothetical protein